MELNDLKEYLRMIVDMEKDIYLQESMISEMEERNSRLGIRRVSEEPTAPMKPEAWIAVLIMSILAFILGIIAFAFFSISLYFFGAVALIFGLSFAFGAIAMSPLIKEESDKYSMESERYIESLKSISENKIRVEKEREEQVILNHELEVLCEKSANSKSTLNKLYSCGIVFPKYRNFTMMCSIYEYICAGRCTTLEGPDGAYNLLEMEIRMDRIIVQLDQVLNSLARIQANQYMLYDAIQENNRIQRQILDNTNQIISGMNSNGKELKAVMESIDKNSALTAYAAERSQKELEYMNTMNYLQSKYSGTGFNQPPSWRS